MANRVHIGSDDPGFKMSNSLTTGLFRLLADARPQRADEPQFAGLLETFAHQADGNGIAPGTVSLDLYTLPWNNNWLEQQRFLHKVIALARSRLPDTSLHQQWATECLDALDGLVASIDPSNA